MDLELTPDQIELRNMARNFSIKELAPNAAKWDHEKIFPTDILKKAGELGFMLIALLGATATWWGFGMHVVFGTLWILFHLFIVTLQAFIFMMLTLAYIGQAHEGH